MMCWYLEWSRKAEKGGGRKVTARADAHPETLDVAKGSTRYSPKAHARASDTPESCDCMESWGLSVQ